MKHEKFINKNAKIFYLRTKMFLERNFLFKSKKALPFKIIRVLLVLKSSGVPEQTPINNIGYMILMVKGI